MSDTKQNLEVKITGVDDSLEISSNLDCSNRKSNFEIPKLLELNAVPLINQSEDKQTSPSLSPGIQSSEWDYKNRREIIEERRTFFNNFLVIERIYEDDDAKSCDSCYDNCSIFNVEIDNISRNSSENDTFKLPKPYLAEVEVVRKRIYPGTGMFKFIYCGFGIILMIFAFAFVFQGIDE